MVGCKIINIHIVVLLALMLATSMGLGIQTKLALLSPDQVKQYWVNGCHNYREAKKKVRNGAVHFSKAVSAVVVTNDKDKNDITTELGEGLAKLVDSVCTEVFGEGQINEEVCDRMLKQYNA